MFEASAKPHGQKYCNKLKKLSNSDTFEFKKHHFWKHYPLITLDTLINGVNSLRGTLFQQNYSRSDFAINNRTSPVRHHSGGATIGTILSPIMLGFMVLHQWSKRYSQEFTLYLSPLKLLVLKLLNFFAWEF